MQKYIPDLCSAHKHTNPTTHLGPLPCAIPDLPPALTVPQEDTNKRTHTRTHTHTTHTHARTHRRTHTQKSWTQHTHFSTHLQPELHHWNTHTRTHTHTHTHTHARTLLHPPPAYAALPNKAAGGSPAAPPLHPLLPHALQTPRWPCAERLLSAFGHPLPHHQNPRWPCACSPSCWCLSCRLTRLAWTT